MYLGFQGMRAIVRLLPLRTARLLGRWLGGLAYDLLGAQRRLTLNHLALAIGESVGPSQRVRIARAVFRNLGQNAMEWLLLSRLSTTDIQRLVTCDGIEHLRGALAQGNGAIALTAHFGNWELIPLFLRSLGFEGGVLARRLRYPEYESFLIGLRGRYGVPTLVRGSLKEVATILRANQVIGMLPDQDIDSLEGVFVNFFGRPAYTPVGPAALSLMTGAPIIPCFLIREGARFRLAIEPPVAIPHRPDRAEAMARLTQSWSDVMESYIRCYPDHWVWMHRRWKTQKLADSTRLTAHSGQHTVDSTQQAGSSHSVCRVSCAVCCFLCAVCCVLCAVLLGCARPSQPKVQPPSAASSGAESNPTAAQQMSEFTLTGYGVDGSKRWVLQGQGASIENGFVTIHRPDGIGYEPSRTAYLTASVAQVNQANRHVRMEHEVTIHTSEGLWFTTPILHWMPDRNEMATEHPVRIETDHMLLRGRGAQGFTQLKQMTVLRDIELVLNPSDQDSPGGGPKQVTITCDGPLAFDYEHHIATFEQNVHVRDPSGDLYSDQLIAYLEPDTHTIRYAEAIGRVRIHQQQSTALSERAIYEPVVGKITLVGKPSLLIYPDDESPTTAPLGFPGLASAARPERIAERR